MYKILRRDPKGCIVLLGEEGAVKDSILNRIEAFGEGFSERILWVPGQSRSQYLALIKCFDVMLDPYPFGGGHTILEAFSVGIPVVTLPPEFARGRLCYSFYRQMDMDDLIAKDEEEYVSLALRLTEEPEFYRQMQSFIERKKNLLFQREEAIHQFEDLLLESHRYALEKNRE